MTRLEPFDGLPATWDYVDGLAVLDGALRGKDNAQREIAIAGLMLVNLLLYKNAAYGNSALEPLSVFAKDVSPRQRMAVRMDDKISRVVRGGQFGSENEKVDLMGYLLLDYIASQHEAENAEE